MKQQHPSSQNPCPSTALPAMFGLSLLVFLALGFGGLIPTSNASPMTITTTSGQLQGTDEGGGEFGLPFIHDSC